MGTEIIEIGVLKLFPIYNVCWLKILGLRFIDIFGILLL